MDKKKGTIMPILRSNISSIPQQKIDSLSKIVKTLIVPDSDEFIPEYHTRGAACCDLRANIPCDETGKKSIVISPGSFVKIDCGFRCQLPIGYHVDVEIDNNLAFNGIFGRLLIENERFYVMLFNCGKLFVSIEHLSVIAKLCLFCVHFCDFVME
jgi:hypothetical protein